MTAKFTSVVEPLPSTVPFVGPEHQERQRGAPFKARIGANESVFGPSPKAIEAMRRAAPEAWMYCDPNMHDLRMAIAEHHDIDPASIVIGEGIDGLFGYTNRLFVERGDKVVTSLGAYPTFNFHVSGYGGELVTAPFVDDHEDPDSLISAAEQHRPKLIYMSNPDNPMGTWHSAGTISKMIERVPDGSLLCLDEAYIEFAPEGTAPPFDTSDRRVIRYRTFSKAYGMAGMRIAYAVTHPDTAIAFDRIRNHFGVSRIAQEAAIAALGDQGHLRDVAARVADGRRQIMQIASASGLESLDSATNFVAVDCGQDGDFARGVLGALLSRDIFVRMPGVAPLDRCIRIGVGHAADFALLNQALPLALADQREVQSALRV